MVVVIKEWEKDGIKYEIISRSLGGPGCLREYFCGYCIFPKRPVIEKEYDGVVEDVRVHGGITFAEEQDDGSMKYGFDCAHGGDDTNPDCRDMDWLIAECKNMAAGILEAADREAAEHRAGEAEQRCEGDR